jgi:putative membrane protein
VARHLGRVAALAGLIVALWLVAASHPLAVFELMRAAGVGLVFAALIHVPHMVVNTAAWLTVIVGARRPRAGAMLMIVWIRESVNSMLPVARVGGEIVGFRLMRKQGLPPSTSVASLVVDMQLTLISELLFTLIGIGFLFSHAQSGSLRIAGDLAWGVAALAPLLLLFAVIQYASPFERLMRVLNRMTRGIFEDRIGESAQIDQLIKAIWRRRRVVLAYLFIWQPLNCLLTSLEIWVALRFLGAPVSLIEAVAIDSLIQALSSAAFFVPGALGVQEGGFLVIGGALGLDPATCVALAGARRVRDLLVFVPGLVAWQFAESARFARA